MNMREKHKMPNATSKIGKCAKKHVICTLVTPDGQRFTGTNGCRRPQENCPRLPGEDYAKCKAICWQLGHAEEIALERAGDKACGATAYLEGIDHYCKPCQRKLIDAGVLILKFGEPRV